MHNRTTSSTSVGFDHVCFDESDPETDTIQEDEGQSHRRVKPYRSFNVFKDVGYHLSSLATMLIFSQVALGTNAFSFCLQVHPSGGLAQSPSPVYHTWRIPWYRQGLYLPASFDLYAGGNVVHSRKDPSPEPQDHRAHIHYRGFEGLLSLRATIDLFRPAGGPNEPTSSSVLAKHCSVELSRKGFGRTYRVDIIHAETLRTFYWKGSKSALSLLETEDNEAVSNAGNGNLKFFDADKPNDVLAVWQNRTDRQILGSLNVISDLDADTDGVLEGLVASCLAVVVAERVSGRGWLGGLGKSKVF
ncbi:hypothetical protein MYU51_004545 [Penicillium brevicompactum]